MRMPEAPIFRPAPWQISWLYHETDDVNAAEVYFRTNEPARRNHAWRLAIAKMRVHEFVFSEDLKSVFWQIYGVRKLDSFSRKI